VRIPYIRLEKDGEETKGEEEKEKKQKTWWDRKKRRPQEYGEQLKERGKGRKKGPPNICLSLATEVRTGPAFQTRDNIGGQKGKEPKNTSAHREGRYKIIERCGAKRK